MSSFALPCPFRKKYTTLCTAGWHGNCLGKWWQWCGVATVPRAASFRACVCAARDSVATGAVLLPWVVARVSCCCGLGLEGDTELCGCADPSGSGS